MTKSNQGTPGHTPEPWIFSETSKGADGIWDQQYLMMIARLEPSLRAKANARRIVACVNACEGIPTEQLEKDFAMSYEAHKSEVKSETKAAQARVAELEKALQGIFDTCPTDPDVTKEFYDAWVRARAALNGGQHE